MTTRRKFIKGAIAAAVAASLPVPVGDGVALNSMAHPQYTHKTYAIATEGMDGVRMHAALARSMMQTRDAVAKRVLSKIFPEDELRTPFQLASLEELEVEIDEPPL